MINSVGISHKVICRNKINKCLLRFLLLCVLNQCYRLFQTIFRAAPTSITPSNTLMEGDFCIQQILRRVIWNDQGEAVQVEPVVGYTSDFCMSQTVPEASVNAIISVSEAVMLFDVAALCPSD